MGRRRRRSHRGAKRNGHQQLTTSPNAGPHGGNHRRPRRQRRPQQPEQQPELPLVCPTWIFNPACNVHVAKDRGWFSDDYVPFQTRIHDSRGVWFEAIGIGTVIIPVKLEEGERGEFQPRNVLHCPDAVCNIVGRPAIEEYGLGYIHGSASRLLVMAYNDDPVAYFEREEDSPFHTLLLNRPPRGARLGRCPFDENPKDMFGLYWPEKERDRFGASQGRAQVPQEENKEATSAPLTDREKAWLKKYWGGEFKFLAAYELSIYKEEDREEGRAIMRTTMAKEEEARELEKHAHDDSHLVDHYFSDDELEEIGLQFGNSKKFLEEYLGFSIHNDEHCRAAKRNIQEFMRQAGLK